MYIYIYIYVKIYIYTYVYNIYVYTSIHVYKHLHTHMYIHIYISNDLYIALYQHHSFFSDQRGDGRDGPTRAKVIRFKRPVLDAWGPIMSLVQFDDLITLDSNVLMI